MGPLMGTRRGGGSGGGAKSVSLLRIAMGFEAAEGERLSLNGMRWDMGAKGPGGNPPSRPDKDGSGPLFIVSLGPCRDGA